MMRKGKIIHLLVCLWVLSLYFGIGKTSNALSQVRTLEDALALITLPNDFLAGFVRVFLDGRGQGIRLVWRLVSLVPFSAYLMLAILALYQNEYRKRSFIVLTMGPLILFAANILILVFALNMMDVASAIQFAVFATRICFVLSIIGALATIVYWFTIESESVES